MFCRSDKLERERLAAPLSFHLRCFFSINPPLPPRVSLAMLVAVLRVATVPVFVVVMVMMMAVMTLVVMMANMDRVRTVVMIVLAMRAGHGRC